MKNTPVDAFLLDVITSLQKHSVDYKIEFILRTPKSLKCNVHLSENLFLAVRYNARNERMDFALIHNNKRIFGYDNLKEWHYHPYKDPSSHIPCERPSMDKIISDVLKILRTIKPGGRLPLL